MLFDMMEWVSVDWGQQLRVNGNTTLSVFRVAHASRDGGSMLYELAYFTPELTIDDTLYISDQLDQHLSKLGYPELPKGCRLIH